MPPRRPHPGIETRRVDGQGMTLVEYRFDPAARFPVHHHPEEQVSVVTGGSVVFHVDGREVELQAGQMVRVAPHVPHGATAGPAGATMLNVLAPRRRGDVVYD
ncbi:cupin [Limnochorda pilosa]|uniref:Cupin n=1 Tax=Limnochorda pilosa TaxID=1555112 RepID=A0A0K2SHE7_LIMPI|nr:cupin [Limnochorda pilosa]